MKVTIMLIIAGVLGGCAVFSPDELRVSPGTPVYRVGSVVYSPDEKGWAVNLHSKRPSVAFIRRNYNGGKIDILYTQIYRVDESITDTELIKLFEEDFNNVSDETKQSIIRENLRPVIYKGTSCLKYEILKDDSRKQEDDSRTLLYLNVIGYACRHPFNKAFLLNMVAVQQSELKSFSVELRQTAESFFSNIEFNDNGFSGDSIPIND